jgi:hypothetical protein
MLDAPPLHAGRIDHIMHLLAPRAAEGEAERAGAQLATEQ